MPWSTPTLREVRSLVRDAIRGSLPGADASVPNSVLRVLSDVQGGTCHLNLQYLDWLALQVLPDTAETEWLDRHGDIWLVNADGSIGRKVATLANGTVAFTGTPGFNVPSGTRLTSGGGTEYETLAPIILDIAATPAPTRALDPGTVGNRLVGDHLSLTSGLLGVDGDAIVVVMSGGTDEETDDQLRTRVLLRIRNPPMGGDAMDYVQWTLAVPGVTRAWCSPLELGMGTVTVRFMCDDLRADNDGFPLPQDIAAVRAYLDSQRPVAVKDIFVESPIPEPINFTISGLVFDSSATRAAIAASVEAMLRERAAPAFAINGVGQPAQEIYAAWVSEAVLQAAGVESFTLVMDDHPMPNAGCLAVLGAITYVP